MAKKSGNFFEQNIDKIVLAVIGLICLAILALMVVRSPNSVVVDGKSYGPGEIDSAISGRVADLDARLEAPAQPRSYTSQFNDFRSMYASAVNVPKDSRLPLPAPTPPKPREYVGPYRQPVIPTPGKPIAGIISGVAAVPLGSSVEMGAEPGDVDLVTVQSTFNTAAIFTAMAQAFNEADLQIPLFAAVELQRQEMNDDGTWSQVWQTVKRTKVDPYIDILGIEQLKAMPVAEAEAFRAQLVAGPVAINVLQPSPYVFQSRTAPWLPPELEGERLKQEARQGMPGGMSIEGGTTTAVPPRQATGRTGMTGTGMESESRTATRTPPPRTPPATTRPTMPGPAGATRPGMMPSGESGTIASTPEAKFAAITIVNIDFLRNMQQVVIWAHDDTAQPGKTYRYRLRLGVLNPIAGRGRSTVDPALAQTLIFWSEFTGDLAAKEPYPSVDVPARMYLFPSKIRESDNMVTIEVAKYNMARWDKKLYEVKPGEMIGRLEKMAPAMDSTGNYMVLPDVDFSTGAMLIDVETVTEYKVTSPNPVSYQQMLYKDSGSNILSLPIRGSNWSKLLRKRYSEIDAAIRNQPLVPVSYTGSSVSGPSYSPGMPTMPGEGGMREE